MGEESTFLWCDKAPGLVSPGGAAFFTKALPSAGLRG